EAPLARGGELPFQRARLRVQRVELAVVARKVDGAAVHRGSGGNWSRGGELPVLASGGGVHGIDVAVIAAEVDHAIARYGGAKDAPASGELPFDAAHGARAGARIRAGVRRVAAKHRVRQAR